MMFMQSNCGKKNKKIKHFLVKEFYVGVVAIFISTSSMAQNFKQDQLRYERVRQAKADKEVLLKNAFTACGLAYPPQKIFIRIFKHEKELELWVKENNEFLLFKTYPFCYASGQLGPKRKQGDLQVPEGIYYIDRFNPASQFYLSLGINYPTVEDKRLASHKDPGGDIFIHGDCVSVGCVAITDDLIKEVYWLAVMAKTAGQQKIPVHFFPFQLNNAFKWFRFTFKYPEHRDFWKTLLPGFDYFEQHKRLKR